MEESPIEVKEKLLSGGEADRRCSLSRISTCCLRGVVDHPLSECETWVEQDAAGENQTPTKHLAAIACRQGRAVLDIARDFPDQVVHPE